jgi:hypothetical protein
VFIILTILRFRKSAFKHGNDNDDDDDDDDDKKLDENKERF